MDFTRQERHILRLWFLSCEDMQIPEGGCKKCFIEEECKALRKKIRET